jgi:hypothetical protein
MAVMRSKPTLLGADAARRCSALLGLLDAARRSLGTLAWR